MSFFVSADTSLPVLSLHVLLPCFLPSRWLRIGNGYSKSEYRDDGLIASSPFCGFFGEADVAPTFSSALRSSTRVPTKGGVSSGGPFFLSGMLKLSIPCPCKWHSNGDAACGDQWGGCCGDRVGFGCDGGGGGCDRRTGGGGAVASYGGTGYSLPAESTSESTNEGWKGPIKRTGWCLNDRQSVLATSLSSLLSSASSALLELWLILLPNLCPCVWYIQLPVTEYMNYLIPTYVST